MIIIELNVDSRIPSWYYWFDGYLINYVREETGMKEFMEYLESKISEGKAEILTLEADGRRDDANFAKVRTNIYDICRTISRALSDKPGAGIVAIKGQLDRFRTVWGAALEKAKRHEDISAVAVEETKLAALEDIVAHFPEVTGE